MNGFDHASRPLNLSELQGCLRRSGAIGPAERIAHAQLVEAKAGRRATYEVTSKESQQRMFVKVFNDVAAAEYAAEAITELSRFFPSTSRQIVAELLGRDERTIVVAAAAGQRLDLLCETRSSSMIGRLAARWLARLHATPVRLTRALDRERERRTLVSWLDTIEGVDWQPATLLDDYELIQTRPENELVPLHKDFHYGHVFIDLDTSVSVIDFDEARMGPADFDVAHFVANLEALGSARRRAWPAVTARHFVAEYRRATGWRTGPDFDRWRSYCLAKILWQTQAGRGPPGLVAARSSIAAAPPLRAWSPTPGGRKATMA